MRIRYSNPLPAPPCPPKLLEIATNSTRHARPEPPETSANDTTPPNIVDAVCGMPLDWSCGNVYGQTMAMIQMSVVPRPIQALAWVPNDNLHASLYFLFPAPNPELKNLPRLGPKLQCLLGDSTVESTLFIDNVASGSTSSSHCGHCHMATRSGVYYKSRGNQPTQFDRRPVRTVFSFFEV